MISNEFRQIVSKKSDNVFSDGKIIIGSIFGSMLSALLFLVFVTVYNRFTTDISLGLISTSATLLISVASILVAAKALVEQQKSREAATDPVLVAYLGQRKDAPSFVTFSISNVGAGAALDVEIEASKPSVDSFSFKELRVDIFSFRPKISLLKQNQTIDYSLTAAHRLLGENPLPPFDVHVRYNDISGNSYSSIHHLDVTQLMHRSSYNPPDARIASSLEKLEKLHERYVNKRIFPQI